MDYTACSASMQIDILNDVKGLLKDEIYWTKDAFARDSEGDKVDPNSDDAVCWCLTGAIIHVNGSEDSFYSVICDALTENIPGLLTSLETFNDYEFVEYKDVLGLIDTTIESLEVQDHDSC